MSIKILRKKEKEKIISKLNEQFGIKDVKGMFLKIGKERLFLYQGDFSEKELNELYFSVPVERIGLYFGKITDGEIRLSIEGVQIVKEQIEKNIVEIGKKDAKLWMAGNELPIKTGIYGFVAIKSGEDFLGMGKASEEKISNYIPKNRRIKGESVL